MYSISNYPLIFLIRLDESREDGSNTAPVLAVYRLERFNISPELAVYR